MKDIALVADSGGNPPGLIDVANELNAKWKGTPARVFYIPEYYDEDRWSYTYMKQTLGITQIPDVQSATRWDIHDDYHYEALVAVQDPKLVHAQERIKAKKFSIYGVEIGSRTGRSSPTTAPPSRSRRSRRRRTALSSRRSSGGADMICRHGEAPAAASAAAARLVMRRRRHRVRPVDPREARSAP
jgi:hypothetical protein